jgi:hypothetical protein
MLCQLLVKNISFDFTHDGVECGLMDFLIGNHDHDVMEKCITISFPYRAPGCRFPPRKNRGSRGNNFCEASRILRPEIVDVDIFKSGGAGGTNLMDHRHGVFFLLGAGILCSRNSIIFM